MSIIEAEGLTKYFYPQRKIWQVVSTRKSTLRDRIPAVEDVNLNVEKGELFGLLGPNGAGKTTLIKILSTLILPTSGTVVVNGYRIHQELQIKASIGLVTGEERSFYWRLNGRENLKFFAILQGISQGEFSKRLNRIGEMLNLSDFIDRRFDSYSSGMKQRLAIARGLLHNPKILFLDEPTRNLDPIAASALREMIRKLAHKEGHTIILVTHQLHEAEELCNRVAIMHKGRIRIIESIENMRREIRSEKLYIFNLNYLPQETIDVVKGLNGIVSFEKEECSSGGINLYLKVYENEIYLPDIIKTITSNGIKIMDIKSKDISLEEIFTKYVTE